MFELFLRITASLIRFNVFSYLPSSLRLASLFLALLFFKMPPIVFHPLHELLEVLPAAEFHGFRIVGTTIGAFHGHPLIPPQSTRPSLFHNAFMRESERKGPKTGFE